MNVYPNLTTAVKSRGSLGLTLNFCRCITSGTKISHARKPNQHRSYKVSSPAEFILHEPKELLASGITTFLPPRSGFRGLVESLSTTLKTTNPPSISRLRALLRAYNSDSLEWSKFAQADATKQYTRNLVYEVPNLFNLLLLVWTPCKASPIHDHTDSHCLMKILKGNLRERRYGIPHASYNCPLVQTSDLNYGLNKVAYMSDKLGVHEISNQSQSEYAVSLHLYFPPNAALRGCKVYNVKTGEYNHTMPTTYDSIVEPNSIF
ncbi:putative membrane Cysteine dioxygenase/cysteine dioxygenase [Blumeria hordei DH14]|uniref:Cysteine dioxygenase n=1 Tax=Blumeria graminis f. sp. hordei (strain DH14) TaxID=546991 RepID=N1JKP6_BLUG1|nr:putative membrane Cysteine dioxygenase/cysteine dioxygenase [Blumeria hordei DH14]